MQNEQVTVSGATGTANLETNVGAVGVGAVGWGFGNGLRVEGEFDYRYNGLRKLSGDGGSVSVSGSEQKFGPMVNVLYDFNGVSPMFVPYIGVGGGYQWGDDKITADGGSASKTVGAFAYQAILGAAMPVASVPGLAITAEYRFMGLAGNRDFGSGVTLSDDFNHSILLGVRYAFGAPAPAMAMTSQAAAPAPAVSPARSYLVFFDWDKAALTDRARSIIKEAADNSTHVQYTRIDVNGYTDTSGTPQYNMGLSIRRADAVKGELIRDGVPAVSIGTQGFGETHLLVPTGNGVREPQNRRVEIVIH
jgi:outer membrane protein OmpA-like peptidoglycan-associated protein